MPPNRPTHPPTPTAPPTHLGVQLLLGQLDVRGRALAKRVQQPRVLLHQAAAWCGGGGRAWRRCGAVAVWGAGARGPTLRAPLCVPRQATAAAARISSLQALPRHLIAASRPPRTRAPDKNGRERRPLEVQQALGEGGGAGLHPALVCRAGQRSAAGAPSWATQAAWRLPLIAVCRRPRSSR